MTLLARFLVHYDPLHHGRTLAGLVSGAIAVAGWHWTRPAGGYNLYRGTSRAGIDYTTPVGSASADATTITLFPWIVDTPGVSYWYALRTIGAGGVECVDNAQDPQICRVTTGDTGQAQQALPAPPRRLQSIPTVGGRFRIRWNYVPNSVALTRFAIYSDNGSGSVSYITPVATVRARGSREGEGSYSWLSSAFAHGTLVRWVLRAVGSAGEEDNESVAVAQADAEGPTAHAVASATREDDE